MTNNNTNLDPDFNFPSSPSSSVPNPIPFQHHQKPRKKRTKLIKIEPNLVPSSSAISTDHIVSKPKQHTKKPDPSAPKITKPCTECGKKFWSWKALFGHMRCHPERQWRGINPPPNYRKPISPIQEEEAAMSAEDHEVAASLLLLSNGVMETGDGAAICSSFPQGEEDLNYGCTGFECSSCKKVFGSHQALGGHRASHKNVKGCFAITRTSIINGDQEIVDADGDHVKEKDNDNKTLMVLGHKCSICLRVFSSGQALGGHKRCHWEKGEDTSNSSMNNIHQGLNGSFVLDGKQNCGLDLNLPATVVEDESCSPYSPGFNLDLRLGI